MKKINKTLFKKVLSKFVTGVTVVGIKNNKIKIGKTINSFSTLSLSPPLILFSLDKKASSLSQFKKSKFLSINILSSNQVSISDHFAKKNSKWNKVKYKLGRLDTPIISNCLANLECARIKTLTAGDHIIFICEIKNVAYNNKIKPLVYYNSKYKI